MRAGVWQNETTDVFGKTKPPRAHIWQNETNAFRA